MSSWSVARSSEVYGIERWGSPYFSIGREGHIQVRPRGDAAAESDTLDLYELVGDIRRRGLRTPLLVRFSDVLASRLDEIHAAFGRAMRAHGYAGGYRAVYPIKANQQRQVVEELVSLGRARRLGLEVGSKAELFAAVAVLDTPGALIVCNGYKDRTYIETALLAQRLGREPVVVLERPQELDILIGVARDLGLRPKIGVRARLAAKGEGLWVDSSGDRSKFGLPASELVRVVDRLREEGLLDCLELLHFHIGSQVTSIRAHKDALREACRVFTGLRGLGAPVGVLNVGGGLGVDYDGSKTSSGSSMNYTLDEYASDVVSWIAETCADLGEDPPEIVTEMGRALVSHASVLVFDVLDVGRLLPRSSPADAGPGEHDLVREMSALRGAVTPANALELYHDAVELKEDAIGRFALGYLDLATRARIEELFFSACGRIRENAALLDDLPPELEALERELADTYYGNFSVFQSLPDSWTIKQLFPVMPIHRLDEEPDRRAVFADLTCDSDGRLDRFIARRGTRDVLDLHAPNGEPYYVGVFLVGAYQETLGEVHNLFGDTDAVHVRLAADGRHRVEEVIHADRVDEILSWVQYDRAALASRVRRAIEDALGRGEITLEESALLSKRYDEGLSSTTYLDRER